MPKPTNYDMYCPVARGLEVLGDRWTLLILRDLAFGDQRFTDLKRSLEGIPPNVLSDRLKALVAEGLVATRLLPPPAARSVYTLTEYGRSTTPVLRALSRFGLQRLEPAGPSTEVRPTDAVFSGVTLHYDPVAAAAFDERYRLEVDGETFELASAKGGPKPRDVRDPDLVMIAPAWALIDVRIGSLSFDEALADGVIKTVGRRTALRHFRKVFKIP